MLNSKELYDKISVWREEKGWTENKLCDMAGVSHSMFHSWLSRGTMPKLDTLESLCYARWTSRSRRFCLTWTKINLRAKKFSCFPGGNNSIYDRRR